ncbi:hypothetical protein Clacol_005015 [Clathrus columnatus]|uniref:Enoyl reductase (ER) domain-containing protein n=1 Tax=Clathrus columnatus TaxID=1419009 RepID=A0AAV5A831_9AGAM|nr:hypothetical protein Clacol_005015 [Clathrus columnatus]
MSEVSNPRLLYKSVPRGYPIPGENLIYDTSRTIDLENVPLNGGFLTKTLVVSPQPWLRERLRDPERISYSTPMRLGHTFVGFGLVKVIRSEDPDYPVGQYVVGMIPWEAYTVQPWDGKQISATGKLPAFTVDVDAMSMVKVAKHPTIPWSLFMGALGGSGQTAYMGLKEHADMKAGETIFVSTAAGSVGMMVVQLAKLAGLKVIATAGTDEKVNYVKNELGADVVFNYNTTSTSDVLQEHGPIDIYWDNVGGPTLEAAIENCNLHARIVACGYMSEYNDEDRYGVKTLSWIFKRRIHIHGIVTQDFRAKWTKQFFEEVPPLISSGKIKVKEEIVHGLENAATSWVDMLMGKNIGKSVVIVAEDD